MGLRALLIGPTAVQILSWPHLGSGPRPCGSKSIRLRYRLPLRLFCKSPAQLKMNQIEYIKSVILPLLLASQEMAVGIKGCVWSLLWKLCAAWPLGVITLGSLALNYACGLKKELKTDSNKLYLGFYPLLFKEVQVQHSWQLAKIIR